MKAEEKNTAVEPRRSARIVSGTVVSDAMDKTVVVRVERKFKHEVVGKTMRSYKKYKAHDESNEARRGDVVEIAECRPLSKTKHMRLQRVVQKAQSNR